MLCSHFSFSSFSIVGSSLSIYSSWMGNWWASHSLQDCSGFCFFFFLEFFLSPFYSIFWNLKISTFSFVFNIYSQDWVKLLPKLWKICYQAMQKMILEVYVHGLIESSSGITGLPLFISSTPQIIFVLITTTVSINHFLCHFIHTIIYIYILIMYVCITQGIAEMEMVHWEDV